MQLLSDNYIILCDRYIYSNIAETPVESSANVIRIIDRLASRSSEIKNDDLLNTYKSATTADLKKEIKQKIIIALQPKTNINIDFLSSTLATMREVKTSEELRLLTKAIRISAVGQVEVMKAMKPHMSETELQGIHEFVYKKYGAEYEGYPSIVGAGNNGCILHYIENNKTKIDNELVLMDLGAEYRGYTADVTRTIPANGKFSTAQKEIYDLVYEAQEAGIANYIIGTSMAVPNLAARKIINEGLFSLGIISSIDEKHNYFPHGTSHHIGLDVHDPGNYRNFEENMVVTMEPGIYIPEGSNCDKKYWGIGIRIEDDILVTKNGPINLSAEAPRTTEEIELMIAKKSVLDEFIFPVTTLRPETIFGITNLWVNPNTIYKKVSVDNETWIVSEECAKKIEFFVIGVVDTREIVLRSYLPKKRSIRSTVPSSKSDAKRIVTLCSFVDSDRYCLKFFIGFSNTILIYQNR